MNERILIVEDEEAIADSLAFSLRSEGFDVDTVRDGETALEAARERTYDVMILDLMLPGISGVEVCRRLRAESALPVLMLTARTAEVDRVIGLDAGADDYVPKPFSMPELISRVRAILRRRELDRGAVIRRVGGVELDLQRRAARVDGENVALTPSEFRLLAYLMTHAGRVCTRRELMQHLWD
ncbi:MAG TPA: response regulator transcription factor, partial [Gaiellaceae bacterium]|nr:response regulator transcription factor [Gaiellaceae bacterium]